MCKISALKKTDQEQRDFRLCSVPPDRTRVRTDCKFKCCFSCTFCFRAARKERHKSSYFKTKRSEIKMCEQCFLCRSIVFCQTCTKCPTCTKSDCWSQTKPVLGNLGNLGGQSQSNTNVERRVHPTLPNQTKLDQKTHNCQLLYKSPQEPLPVGGIASAHKQKCNRVGHKPSISGLLQPAIFGPKTKQQILDQSSLKFLKVENSKWRHQK